VSTPLIFDRTSALERVEGDVDFLKELVGDLESSTKKSMLLIKNAAECNDVQSVLEQAHSMKGSFYNLGAMAAGTVAFELEKRARAGSLEGAGELILRLEEESVRFHKEFQEENF
jgi:HPt (histidine-containing phosphotransfer) domain-containing protein